MAQITISESILKPGVGYVPFKSETVDYPVQGDAEAAFDFYKSFWGEGADIVEQEGTTVEFQVGGWRRVMVDMA